VLAGVVTMDAEPRSLLNPGTQRSSCRRVRLANGGTTFTSDATSPKISSSTRSSPPLNGIFATRPRCINCMVTLRPAAHQQVEQASAGRRSIVPVGSVVVVMSLPHSREFGPVPPPGVTPEKRDSTTLTRCLLSKFLK
jgi:hypothetical protein